MQNGREPSSNHVKIEGDETGDHVSNPVNPEDQLDEVARSAGDKVKDGGSYGEAAPEDPEEAQSPT